MESVLLILLVIMAFIIGTAWLWIPILIIVLVIKSKNNKQTEEEKIEAKARELLQQQGMLPQAPQTPQTPVKPAEEARQRLAQNVPAISGAGQQAVTSPSEEVRPTGPDYSSQNIILYLGSLLIVAGAGGVVMTVTNDATRLMILLLMTLIFYIAGMLVRKNQKLVIAGNAFVGTALAIIPFLGFAFAGFAKIPGEISWLITSIIGVVTYLATAVVIKSKVVSYLAVGFFVSLACSMAASLRLNAVWYLVMTMAVGVALGMVRIFVKSEKLGVMAEAIDNTGRWLTILTLGASLMVATLMTRVDYLVIFAIAAVQMLVVWMKTRDMIDELLMRAVAHGTVIVALAVAIDAESMWQLLAGCVMVTVALHMVISMMLALMYAEDQKRTEAEQAISAILAGVIGVFSLVLIGSVWGVVGAVLVLLSGLAGRVVFRDDRWLNFLTAGLILIPLTGMWNFLTAGDVRVRMTKNSVAGWSLAGMYAGELLVATGVLVKRIKSKKVLEWYTGEIMLTALGVGLTAVIIWIGEGYYIWMGVLAWAGAMLMDGVVRKQQTIIEAAVYGLTAAMSLFLWDLLTTEVTTWLVAMVAHLFAIALIGMSLWRKEPKAAPGRMMIAIMGVSLIMGILALSTTKTEGAVWQILFLIEEVAITVVGALMKEKWMWITGAVGTGMAVMWFTKEIAYVWFIFIGVGLIWFVIWRLLKNGLDKR